ncbi:MAG: hypothetical protein NVSMB46_03640 [Candidatus Saccharimonadales bacterium]
MFISAKLKNNNVSSRVQIDIKGVRDGILQLSNHRYRAILQISSLNFELKSEAEQDAIIDTYQSFLNSLSTPIQILVRIREMDLDKYISDMQSRLKDETQQVYAEQISNYTDFVRSLVTTNKILTRTFYVIVPLSSSSYDFASAAEQIQLLLDIVSKGLGRLGMKSRQLGSLEVMDLFYSFYNPTKAKSQPLSQRTLSLLAEAYL